MTMKHGKWTLLAAMLLGAAALTGCTTNGTTAATTAPAAQQETASLQNATEKPTGQTAKDAEETANILKLTVLEKDVQPGALREDGKLLLPLIQTGEALGWKAKSEEKEEESQVRKSVTLEKEESRITVNWISSDNTARSITWQKDGMLIPVDTMLTSRDGSVFVPAAFFEEATGAKLSESEGAVRLDEPETKATPETLEQS